MYRPSNSISFFATGFLLQWFDSHSMYDWIEIGPTTHDCFRVCFELENPIWNKMFVNQRRIFPMGFGIYRNTWHKTVSNWVPLLKNGNKINSQQAYPEICTTNQYTCTCPEICAFIRFTKCERLNIFNAVIGFPLSEMFASNNAASVKALILSETLPTLTCTYAAYACFIRSFSSTEKINAISSPGPCHEGCAFTFSCKLHNSLLFVNRLKWRSFAEQLCAGVWSVGLIRCHFEQVQPNQELLFLHQSWIKNFLVSQPPILIFNSCCVKIKCPLNSRTTTAITMKQKRGSSVRHDAYNNFRSKMKNER